MKILLAPVFQSFLRERELCRTAGGFVVGPIGETTAGVLFDFAHEYGKRDVAFPSRFSFEPMLPAAIYESHPTIGGGAFRYVGLYDEIEINDARARYRHQAMKPGQGVDGELADNERMPAFVRFRVVEPVSAIIPGVEYIRAGQLGQNESVLRRFKFGKVETTALRVAFERLYGMVP